MAENGQKWYFRPKMAQNGIFGQKWPKMVFSAKNGPKWYFWPKMAKNGQKWYFRPKMAQFRFSLEYFSFLLKFGLLGERAKS